MLQCIASFSLLVCGYDMTVTWGIGCQLEYSGVCFVIYSIEAFAALVFHVTDGRLKKVKLNGIQYCIMRVSVVIITQRKFFSNLHLKCIRVYTLAMELLAT